MANQVILSQVPDKPSILVSVYSNRDNITVTNLNTPQSMFEIKFNDVDDYHKFIASSAKKYIHATFDKELSVTMVLGGWLYYLQINDVDSVAIELLSTKHKWYVIASWYDIVYGQKQLLGYNTISKEYSFELTEQVYNDLIDKYQSIDEVFEQINKIKIDSEVYWEVVCDGNHPNIDKVLKYLGIKLSDYAEIN